MPHKVRTHHWYNGILEFKDHVFETLDRALHFANTSDANVTKVYDENDAIVHQVQKTTSVDTYA